MKKHIFIFCLLLSLFAAPIADAATIEVSTTEINFGVVRLGTNKQETFTVTNTGADDVTIMVDASTEFTYRFEVSDNLEEFTLHSGETKIYTATSHGMEAGWDASTKVFVKTHDGETLATIKLKAIGDDDRPLVDQTSLTMMVGERSSVYLKTNEYRIEVDNWDVVDGIGGGSGTGGGLSDGHDSEERQSSSGLTFIALKPGVAVVTFKHNYTDEVAILTITVLDPVRPTTDRNAIYNYRNDGDFNAFLNMDVDSITYSKTDLNGRVHPNVVVQEVWTPDSVYRIPLAGIDSIAFKAPEPIMQDGIFYLRDYHAANTLAVDSLTLYFSNSISNDSLPAIGQVVLNAVETTPYEEGFAGKVVSIQHLPDRIKVECEMLCVHDVYKRLVLVGKVMTESEAEEQMHIKRSPDRIDTDYESTDIKVIDDLGTFSFPCFGGLFTLESKNPSAVISYYVYVDELVYRMSGTVNILHKDLEYHFNISLQKIMSQAELDDDLMDCLTRLWNYKEQTRDKWIQDLLADKLEEENKDIENPDEIDIINSLWKDLHWSKTIPLAGPLVLDLEIGPLLKFKGDVEFDAAFKTTARNHFFIEAGGNTLTLINPVSAALALASGDADISGRATFNADPISDISFDAKMKGSLSAGITGKATISLIHKNVVHASVSAEGGFKLAGALDYKIEVPTEPQDMNLYESLKDTKIKADWFVKAAVELGITKNDFLTAGMEWEWTKNIGTTYLMPHFTEPLMPTYSDGLWSNGNNNKHNILESKPSKSIPHLILGPCTLGMKIVNSQGTVVKEYYDESREYDGETLTWGLYPLSIALDGLKPNETYRCYPMFRYKRLWTHSTTATPSHEFTVPKTLSFSHQSPVHLSVGKKQGVSVIDGWGLYDIINENPDVVKMSRYDVVGTPNITLEGLAVGQTTIKAIDQYSGEEVNLVVVVDEGDGTSVLSITPTEIDFGDVASGNTVKKVLTISNDSEVSQTVTATIDAPFSFAYDESSMSSVTTAVPAKSCSSLIVMFTAATLGEFNGNITVSCDAIEGGQCIVPVHARVGNDVGEHEYVDLGLPSGTLWATCNVGASAPEEYGDYFAWGETEPKDYYDWSTYMWCNGSRNTMTKYCIHSDLGYNGFTDGKTELDPEDDAAYVNWGPSWQIPTLEQQNELVNNCTWQWTTCNGVLGFLGTGPNGNTLFLPASGSYNGSLELVGSIGRYWSRTLEPECSYRVEYRGFFEGSWQWYGSYRYSGNSIRAVRVSEENHDYVDLGLPSGTLWATCNVGADSPEEYGDYFAWGETEPKEVYNLRTYKWCNGSESTLTKYCIHSDFGYDGFTDGKTELDPEDDAAYVNCGPSWRMPSMEQQKELIEQSAWTWTTSNGVNGCLVTGPNGNTLFLPAAGHREYSTGLAGLFGYYWSRTLYSNLSTNGNELVFKDNLYSIGHYYRYDGHAVRAVRMP